MRARERCLTVADPGHSCGKWGLVLQCRRKLLPTTHMEVNLVMKIVPIVAQMQLRVLWEEISKRFFTRSTWLVSQFACARIWYAVQSNSRWCCIRSPDAFQLRSVRFK